VGAAHRISTPIPSIAGAATATAREASAPPVSASRYWSRSSATKPRPPSRSTRPTSTGPGRLRACRKRPVRRLSFPARLRMRSGASRFSDTHVFWGSPSYGPVRRVAKLGSATAQALTPGDLGANRIAVDATGVYFTSKGVWRMAHDGSELRQLTSAGRHRDRARQRLRLLHEPRGRARPSHAQERPGAHHSDVCSARQRSRGVRHPRGLHRSGRRLGSSRAKQRQRGDTDRIGQ
jgi:hypothetical protein